MIDRALIARSVGMSLCALACAMLLPITVDLADSNHDWQVFAISAMLSLFIGVLLNLTAAAPAPAQMNLRTGFLLTTVTWVTVTAFSAVPFIGVGLSYTDAYFESMSGLTTTGSTVLTHLDVLPRGLLMWRSELQAFGGLGIIVTALLLLPFLRIGGMQLFAMESSDQSEKIFPRSAQISAAITGIYLLLIATCGLAYWAFGMTSFDAFCHALTTVSTGGFSTHDLSFGFFQSDALQWICIVFMILGSLPFLLVYRGLMGRSSEVFADTQIVSFMVILVLATIAMSATLLTTEPTVSPDIIRRAAFNAVSIITTTGFASEDYSVWGPFAIGIAFVLMFIGGCSGSTAGGVKIYRLEIVWLIARSHFINLASPHRVVPIVYNRRKLGPDISFSVITFVAVYLFTVGFFTAILAGSGLDLVTSLSASAQALASVGPGLGDIVGPAGNYANIPNIDKWALSFAMLLGRLELFTVLVLFAPDFWRN